MTQSKKYTTEWIISISLMVITGLCGIVAFVNILTWSVSNPQTNNGEPQTSSSGNKNNNEFVLTYSGSVQSNGTPSPWEKRTFVSGKKAELKVEELNSQNNIHLISERSSFSINRELSLDTSKYQSCTWNWKAIKLPDGDVRKNGFFNSLNDQALQVLIVFENRRVVSYIWDTNAPLDHEQDDSVPGWPIKVRVVESGAASLNQWITEEVNLIDDYERLYGQTVPDKIVGIRLQTNSQHSRTEGEGYIGPIRFISN